MAVDAVVYYRISNATIAITNVEDYGHSTRLLAATTLRNVLGTKNLSEILSERESISHVMQVSEPHQHHSFIHSFTDSMTMSKSYSRVRILFSILVSTVSRNEVHLDCDI